jgi:polysaccharide pyruvyl transferase WcaK-like protein
LGRLLEQRRVLILVEPMGYHLLNLGDVAMRQMAVRRLSELWPEAEIRVLADDPSALAIAIPRATHLSTAGRRDWFYAPALGPLRRVLPARVADRALEAERGLRRRRPRAVAGVVRARRRLTRRAPGRATEFLDAVLGSDLVVVSGGGGLNDYFAQSILSVLDTIEMALERDIPCVMMGQGLGPLSDRRLLDRVRAVLPRLGLLGLREDVTARPLLTAIGMPVDRVVTTGDDAVELAHELRGESVGTELGLNVRIAGYAPVTEAMLERVGGALRRAIDERRCGLLPLPVSRHGGERDLEVVLGLAHGSGARALSTDDTATPGELVRRIGACRVVVTGSYHAAVFALAQGIPAVCLITSSYYDQKFLGLAALFGAACRPVSVDDPAATDRLADAISAAWETAHETREPLLAAAREQIAAGRGAYARLPALVGRET